MYKLINGRSFSLHSLSIIGVIVKNKYSLNVVRVIGLGIMQLSKYS